MNQFKGAAGFAVQTGLRETADAGLDCAAGASRNSPIPLRQE
jgi:hypothetical protein